MPTINSEFCDVLYQELSKLINKRISELDPVPTFEEIYIVLMRLVNEQEQKKMQLYYMYMNDIRSDNIKNQDPYK